MDLMETPLGDEVNRVIDAAGGFSNVYVNATLHTLYGDVPALRVLNHDVIRHYHTQYSDEISITLTIPAGKHAYRVITSRNELELTLEQTKASAHGVLSAEEAPLAVERYRAILKVNDDPTLEGNSRELLAENTMDLQAPITIELQLISLAMEQFSVLTCGGTFRRTKVEDLVKYLLLSQSGLINLSDAYRPLGVDMVKVNDATLREHIVIPHGLPTSDAVGYIHKFCGGVYSTGLSYYYQDDYWYVYPTYDYKRFQTATRQLVIINIPKHKLPGLDCTYLQEGNCVTIISTGEVTFDDTSDQRKRSSGNGLRFADASILFESAAQTADNKLLLSRAKVNNEFASSKQKNDINRVQMSDNRITSNVMYETSKLAVKEGVFIQLAWENADPSLIKPGMQTKLMYFKNGEIKTIYGIVLGLESSTQYQGYGIVTGRYNRTVGIQLFAANSVQQLDNN